LYFCLHLRSLNRTTLRSVHCRKVISKLRDYNWRLRRERVNQWRNSSHTYKDNSTVHLINIATIIILVSCFIYLVSIATFSTLVIFFSLLLLKRTLTLQILLLLLLLRVLFLLRRFIPIWNARMVSNISSISPLKEFCLNSRAYNIPSKSRDRCMKRKNRDKNGIPWVRDCK